MGGKRGGRGRGRRKRRRVRQREREQAGGRRGWGRSSGRTAEGGGGREEGEGLIYKKGINRSSQVSDPFMPFFGIRFSEFLFLGLSPHFLTFCV